MRRRVVLACVVLLTSGSLGLVAACEGATNPAAPPVAEGGPITDGNEAVGDATADADSSIRLGTDPSTILLRPGESVDVKVTLDRSAGLGGAFTAKLGDLPAGVSATAAQIEDGATTASLTVTATTGAIVGSSQINLSLEPAALPPVGITLLIAGPPGTLDPSFGDGGRVLLESDDIANVFGLAVQPDGKIVVVGSAHGPSFTMIGGLRRYLPDGTADLAFNANTKSKLAAPMRGVGVDAHGRILVVGMLAGVARFDENGTFERVLEIDDTFFHGRAVAVAHDGGIIAVGGHYDEATGQWSGLVARWKDDGSRDTMFNAGNNLLLPNVDLEGLAVAPDGRVVIGGTFHAPGRTSYFLMRLTANGARDPTFGSAGKVTFADDYRAHALVPLPDGTYALTGDTTLDGGQREDPQMTAGLATSTGAALWARSLGPTGIAAGYHSGAAEKDGRVVAAGYQGRINRLLPDGGGLDVTFGDAGTVTDLQPDGGPPGPRVFHAAVVLPDSRIVVAGADGYWQQSGGSSQLYRLWGR